MTCTRGCCESNQEHWRSVGIAPSATPTRTGQAAQIKATEQRWGKDMDAYRRLRNDGEQPNQIDGAAKVEQHAESRVEVESGRLLTKKQRKQYRAATEGAA